MTEQALEGGVTLSKSGQQAIRLLISSYFIGAATGVVPYEAGRGLVLLLIGPAMADMAFSAFLFATAWLVLIPRTARGAALLLALFVFWAGYMASFGPDRTLPFHAFWRDLALIGGLLLTYGQNGTSNPDAAVEGDCPRARLVRRQGTQPGVATMQTPNGTGHDAFAQSPDEMAGLFSQALEIR